MNKQEAFEMQKKKIIARLKEIQDLSPELEKQLNDSIIWDESIGRFMFCPEKELNLYIEKIYE